MTTKRSPGFALIDLVRREERTQCWEVFHRTIDYAKTLAIGARLHFAHGDLDKLSTRRHWNDRKTVEFTPQDYGLAIIVKNMSFIQEYERHYKFQPFFANDVILDGPYCRSHGFMHVVGSRHRERLAPGFCVGDTLRRVTSIKPDHVVISEYPLYVESIPGKPYRPISVKRFTHKQLAELYPAKKRPKRTEEPE